MSVISIPQARETGWSRVWAQLRDWVAGHTFLLALVLVTSPLLFVNLGNSYSYIDEANTMLIAKNVLHFGYPLMWDGEYLISPFFDADMTKEIVWISHPWLQFYVAAGSFALLGFNTVAARFPFALAGLLSVIAIYYLAKLMSGSKGLAQLTAVLLALHTGFLVYSRQSRYYSLVFLFTILTVLTFLLWLKQPNRRNLLYFVLSSVLLFHAYYPFWVFLSLFIGLYFLLIERRWRLLPALIVGIVLIAVLTVPWFIYANPHAPVDTGPVLETWGSNFLLYLWKLDTWIAPLLTLTLILLILFVLQRVGLIHKQEVNGLPISKTYLLFTSVIFYTAFIAVIPILTTQYAMPAIPFFIILAAFIVWKIREYNRWVGAAVVVLLVTTNLLNIFPHIVVEKSGIAPASIESVVKNPRCDFVIGPSLEHYLKDELMVRSYLFEFVHALPQDYDNRVEGIITYLNRYGTKDQTVLSFWGDANILRFYTGMQVVYNFFPLFDNPRIEALVYQPNIKPDWVVPDTLYFYPPNPPFFTYNPDDYEMIRVPFPKEYFDNAPNLDETEFSTNRDAPTYFYLLHRKASAD